MTRSWGTILSEKSESSFAPRHSFCEGTTFWRDTPVSRLALNFFFQIDTLDCGDSAEKPCVPMNRLGIVSPDESKLRMLRVEDDIALSTAGDDTWYSKNRGPVFLNPSISESSGAGYILGVPVSNLVNRNGLDGHIVRNDNTNHPMVLWRLRKIGMNQNLKESASIRFGSVDCSKANRVPATPMKHGTSGIEDRMTCVGDSIGDHLYR